MMLFYLIFIEKRLYIKRYPNVIDASLANCHDLFLSSFSGFPESCSEIASHFEWFNFAENWKGKTEQKYIMENLDLVWLLITANLHKWNKFCNIYHVNVWKADFFKLVTPFQVSLLIYSFFTWMIVHFRNVW